MSEKERLRSRSMSPKPARSHSHSTKRAKHKSEGELKHELKQAKEKHHKKVPMKEKNEKLQHTLITSPTQKLAKHNETFQYATWRTKLGEFLESKWVQNGLLAIVVLDLLFLITELILEEYEEHIDEHTFEEITDAFRYCSITIVSILLLESLSMIVAFGRTFFKHPFYVMDFLLAVASLVVEVVLKNFLAASALIVFRLWRVVRITQSFVVALEEREQHLLEHLYVEIWKLDHAVQHERWKKYNKILDEIKHVIIHADPLAPKRVHVVFENEQEANQE